ncbi:MULTISPECIES: aldehyde dehydrogenase family protein [Pseudomonas]|uniref:aldehyde dehydrogenase family protein n=1 Tax=Pseudomonas TaxID=286 RepID=UPI0015968818|nr:MULTISPECIES: aldehyde dehydrogenase family protein [Pseudomonas]
MNYLDHFYIDGRFVEASGRTRRPVINPATLKAVGSIALGNAEDVDAAVAAARRAFGPWSRTPREQRLAVLKRFEALCIEHQEALAQRMTLEMGTPISFSRQAQVAGSLAHIRNGIEILEGFAFERESDGVQLRFEPVGVCGLITPWNFPVLQVITKLIPALATGCTVVLKPSEYSPLSTMLLAELLHQAELPAGVFNLVNGDGAGVGQALSSHPDIDMVSFTGSTRAGVSVAQLAAPTVKRVHQELGGNSANILLADADLASAVANGVHAAYRNAGQSCTAPGRMLVPAHLHDQAVAIAREAAQSVVVGDVFDARTTLGPVMNKAQHDRAQALIAEALADGAVLVTGGLGLPDGVGQGFFIKPTVLANVTEHMRIAREEIFAPVVCLIPYQTPEHAVAMANDTPYGLAAYLQGSDRQALLRMAGELRVGQVQINQPAWVASAPFGGYKQSGNGRECGEFGFEAYLEVKAVLG